MKKTRMNSRRIALVLLIGIIVSFSGHDALTYPERFDRLPTWGGHSQIGGPLLDTAHRENREKRENRVDLCRHCFCIHLKAICDYKLNKTVSFSVSVLDSCHIISPTPMYVCLTHRTAAALNGFKYHLIGHRFD